MATACARSARQLSGSPQEIDYLTRAAEAYREALTLYANASNFANVPMNIRLTQRALSDVQVKLDHLSRLNAAPVVRPTHPLRPNRRRRVRCDPRARTVGVTHVSATVRDARRRTDMGRRLSERHLVLVITSVLAALAIGLSYSGRIEAQRLAASQQSARPINLNTVTDSRQLERLFAPIFTSARDREIGAQRVLDFILADRNAGDSLPNVGALLRETPVLTSAQLALLEAVGCCEDRRDVRTADVAMGNDLPGFHLGDTTVLVGPQLSRRLCAARCHTSSDSARVRGTADGQDPLRDTLLFVRYTQGVSMGLLAFAALSVLDFRKAAFLTLSYAPLAAALILSILLIVFGDGPGTSNAKVNLGPIQPIEAIRLLLALFLAGYFARRWELLRQVRARTIRDVRIPRWLNLPKMDYVLPVVAGVAAALVFFFLQRDLGPALFISCVFLAIYAIARNRVGMAILGVSISGRRFLSRIQIERLDDPRRARADVAIAVGQRRQRWRSNRAGGMGLLHGRTVRNGPGSRRCALLPAGHTDLVLAALGEELGFVGLLCVACVFAIIAARGFTAAFRADSDYGFFLATAVTLFLALPVLIMSAGMLGVVPLTGVVTPFLSYGGSAMVANFAAIGVLTSIGSHSQLRPTANPFRPATKSLIALLGIGMSGVLAALVSIQVFGSDRYVVQPHLGVQSDGVRRFQYNPRVLDVAALIPRGTVYH